MLLSFADRLRSSRGLRRHQQYTLSCCIQPASAQHELQRAPHLLSERRRKHGRQRHRENNCRRRDGLPHQEACMRRNLSRAPGNFESQPVCKMRAGTAPVPHPSGRATKACAAQAPATQHQPRGVGQVHAAAARRAKGRRTKPASPILPAMYWRCRLSVRLALVCFRRGFSSRPCNGGFPLELARLEAKSKDASTAIDSQLVVFCTGWTHPHWCFSAHGILGHLLCHSPAAAKSPSFCVPAETSCWCTQFSPGTAHTVVGEHPACLAASAAAHCQESGLFLSVQHFCTGLCAGGRRVAWPARHVRVRRSLCSEPAQLGGALVAERPAAGAAAGAPHAAAAPRRRHCGSACDARGRHGWLSGPRLGGHG